MSDEKMAAKSRKLGMNFMTAKGRLERDLLFKMVVEAGHKCHRCAQPLERENFSVDHKSNWGQAEDPKAAFFDLANIGFSHHHCNSRHTSRTKYWTREERYAAQLKNSRERRKRNYAPEQRHDRYERTGY